LTAANFRGEYQGRPIKIISAALDTTSRRVVVIVDTSGTAPTSGITSEKDPRKATWKAVEELVRTLAPHHMVAILTANEDLQKHFELTNDEQALDQALRQVGAGHQP
jgi:hypothetical protein